MKNLIGLITLSVILVGCGSAPKRIVRINDATVIETSKEVKHDIDMEQVFLAVKNTKFTKALNLLNKIETDDAGLLHYNVRSISHEGELWKTKFKKVIVKHFITNLKGLWTQAQLKCRLDEVNTEDTSSKNLRSLHKASRCLRTVYRKIDTIRTDSYTNPLFNSCLTDDRLSRTEKRLNRHQSWCSPLAITTFPNKNGDIKINTASTVKAWIKHWGGAKALELDELKRELQKTRSRQW